LFYTLVLLDRHTGRIRVGDFLGQHARLFIASLLAMLPLFAASQYFGWVNAESGALVRFGELTLIMLLGLIGYFFVGRRIGVSEISNSGVLIRAQVTRVKNSRRKPRDGE